MKKNFFIAFFALVLVMPSWATGVITGSDTLVCVNQYTLNGALNVDHVYWTFNPNFIPEDLSSPVVNLSGITNSNVSVARGKYRTNIFGEPIYDIAYAGPVTLTATIYHNNGDDPDIVTKQIILPAGDTLPAIPRRAMRKITPLSNPRTITIPNCLDVPDNMLKWEIYAPQSSTIDSIHYGRSCTIEPTISGTMTIKLYNLQLCSSLSANYNIGVDLHMPYDPLDPLLLYPNPVTTGTIEISVINKNSKNSSNNIDTYTTISYTMELWDSNSQKVRIITSSISGEEDKVYMNVDGLRNGIYILILKVNDEILTSSKMIINR